MKLKSASSVSPIASYVTASYPKDRHSDSSSLNSNSGYLLEYIYHSITVISMLSNNPCFYISFSGPFETCLEVRNSLSEIFILSLFNTKIIKPCKCILWVRILYIFLMKLDAFLVLSSVEVITANPICS